MQARAGRRRLEGAFGQDTEITIAECRHRRAREIVAGAVQRTAVAGASLSDRLDGVLTNRLIGLPIFALLMYLTFWLVFTAGAPAAAMIEAGQGWLVAQVAGLWPVGSESMLKSLLLDGVIAGVGGVIMFVPNIMLLFFALALLEDTGYMPRAAFLMDRLMKWFGLHGKSSIPMLIGFGCSVPAVMATRVLDNRRDRLITILVLPLMSCSARLPIYMLIIPAFFGPGQSAMVLYSMYVIGIVVAIGYARLLRSTVFRGKPAPFVMELPPYRFPTVTAVLRHTWQRGWMYLRKAGTIILGFSIVLWGLSNYPKPPAERLVGLSADEAGQTELRYSIAGRIGQGIEPVVGLMGFDWKIGTALIGALPAKELFVAQMGIVYSLGQVEVGDGVAEAGQAGGVSSSAALRARLRADYSRLVGFCVMLFCLLSSPCLATVAVTRRETSWGWALVQMFGLGVGALVITTCVYQVGALLGAG